MLAPERLPDPLLEPHLPVLAPMLPAVLPGPGGLQQQHARVVPRGLVPRRAEVLGPLDVPVLPGPEDYVVAEVARLQHGPEALGRVGPGPGLATGSSPGQEPWALAGAGPKFDEFLMKFDDFLMTFDDF